MRIIDNNEKIMKSIEDFIDGVTDQEKFRIAHISHLDLDGYGSTVLTNMINTLGHTHGFVMTYFNITPNKVNETLYLLMEEIDLYDLIIVTDLAINQPLVDMIVNSEDSHKILIFDHHLSPIQNLPDNILVTKDSPIKSGKATCATELYYNFLQNSAFIKIIADPQMRTCVEQFVECVRIYDTYEFWAERHSPSYENYILAPNLNILFHIMDKEEFFSYVAEYITNGQVDQLLINTKSYLWIEKVIQLEVDKTNKYIAAAIKRMSRTNFKYTIYKKGKIVYLDYNVGVVFAEKSSPLIANNLLELYDDIEICAVVSNNQISIYTKKSHIDVSEIARLFNGGGHKEAAGFIIPYQNSATFNITHFNSMIECAGSIAPPPID